MPKYEIIVRETRVLKYKIEAPTQQIGIDRIITDSYLNPLPYQTQRLSREIYAVDLPEPAPVAANNTPSGVPWMPSDANIKREDGLTTHPTEPTPPVQDTPKTEKKKRGRRK